MVKMNAAEKYLAAKRELRALDKGSPNYTMLEAMVEVYWQLCVKEMNVIDKQTKTVDP